MDRRRKMLVNIGEEEADSVLRDVADKFGVRVFAKPRLADTVDIDSSGLPNDLYSHALKAHLDFVVARGSDAQALFAVEFDGAYHDSDAARRRDAMKDTICERLGLPLLRVDADFFQTVKGFRLLAWLVELWFLDEAVTEMQASGAFPWDEPFDPRDLYEPDEHFRLTRRPFDLASEAQAALFTAYKEGRCLAPHPDHYFTTTDDGGESYAFLPLPYRRWLMSHVRVRAYRFPPLSPGELADDLACVEIASKLEEYERGTVLAVTGEEVDTISKRCAGWSCGIFRPDTFRPGNDPHHPG
jgi:hypothetical protein